MFGANGCSAVEKCRMCGGKDNTHEDKKAWNNQNIKYQLGDSQQQETQREREEGKKASCLNSICSLGSDKKHSEESNAAGMTTVHLNNTIIPCHSG